MPDIDDTRLAERLEDVARSTARSVATPAFAAAVAQARARRRAQGLSVAGAAAAVTALVVSLTTFTGAWHLADSRPLVSPTPSVSDLGDLLPAETGTVTDLVALPGGGLAVLYAACPQGRETCVPHAYLSTDGGHQWTGRYDFDGNDHQRVIVRSDGFGPTTFDLSMSGDVALLTDEEQASPATGKGHVAAGVLLDSTDPAMNVTGIAEESGPLSRTSVHQPDRAVPATRSGGFDVVADGARRPLQVASVAGLVSGDFIYTAAVDGVLTAKAREGTDAVSLDLGDTWLAVPALPRAGIRGPVVPQGPLAPQRFVRFGRGPFDDAYGYPITQIQVSTDAGLTWTTKSLTAAASGQLITSAVPISATDVLLLDTAGQLHGIAAKDRTRMGPVRSIGGHRGQAWAAGENGSLWFRDPSSATWTQIDAPE